MGIFTGKTILLTGGGRALPEEGRAGSVGYGVATAFAREGANLVLTGRNEQKLQDAKEELERLYGVRVLAQTANMDASPEAEQRAEDAVTRGAEVFGHIDVLINCAQSTVPETRWETGRDQLDLPIFSGLYATYCYMRACHPCLRRTRGSVINFALGTGVFGNVGQASCAAAKAGILELTRVASEEWASEGINVNAVTLLDSGHTPGVRRSGRCGDAETEIGRICLQLASPDFHFMTGETITLEGKAVRPL